MSDSLPNTDPATNSRFKDLGNGSYSEAMAPMVVLHYDVNNMAARAQFHCQPFIKIGDSYFQFGNDVMDVLEVDFVDEMDACYGAGILDPVTKNDLGGFSVAGMMLKMKIALDAKHNLRAQKRLEAVALAERRAALARAVTSLSKAVVSPSAGGTSSTFTFEISGQTVTFQDTSEAGELLSLTNWTWVFNDGIGSSTEQNPTYAFEKPGTYEVTLGVTDSSGQVVCSSQTVVIEPTGV